MSDRCADTGYPLFVLGGARSGKSRYAQAQVEAWGGRLAYIATAQAFDEEMQARIACHRRERDARWTTYEEPIELADAIAAASVGADAILVDCLTLWLSNLLLAGRDVAGEGARLVAAVQACSVPIALVSNEVGMGIVPEHALSRLFRDEAGRLNQRVAQAARRVVFVAAGLGLALKG